MFIYISWILSALWGLVMHFVMWKDKSIASKCIGVIVTFVGGVVIGAVGETLEEEYEVEIKDRKKAQKVWDSIASSKKANATQSVPFGT